MPPPDQTPPSQLKPGHTFAAHAASIVSGGVQNSRSFEEIISEEKTNRNILEFHITKITTTENQQHVKIMNLTFDDLSIFIFNTLKIKHQDCLGIDYTTGRYDHREVQLKPGVDVNPYITGNTPMQFKNHNIFVKRQTNNITKVLFRKVPLNVPDEEILNLCICYGEVVEEVKREKLCNKKDKGMLGSNRSVDVILRDGASFENYYWMEGPLPGDQGRRITVTHPSQPQQCSHCFSYDGPKYGISLEERCPAKGNGKACKEMEIKERAKMTDYMYHLEKWLGYVSLKTKYFRNQPIFNGNGIAAYDKLENRNDDEDTEVSFATKITNSIIEKLLLLEKAQERMPALIQELKNTKAVLKSRKEEQRIGEARFNLANKIAEERIAETVRTSPDFMTDNPHLISMLAVFQERDQFEVDVLTGDIKPNNEDDFLKVIADDVIKFAKQTDHSPFTIDQYKDRLKELKSHVLGKMKEDKRFFPGTTAKSVVFGRWDSTSSSCSKRHLEDMAERRSSRPRV